MTKRAPTLWLCKRRLVTVCQGGLDRQLAVSISLLSPSHHILRESQQKTCSRLSSLLHLAHWCFCLGACICLLVFALFLCMYMLHAYLQPVQTSNLYKHTYLCVHVTIWAKVKSPGEWECI